MASLEDVPAIRPRVSLLNLLLVTALLATSLKTAFLWREVGPLRQKVRQLQGEVGELSIEDESRPHAVRVYTHNNRRWKWRVWLPPGAVYRLHLAGEGIPKSGLPLGSLISRTVVGAGEHVIEYEVAWHGRDEAWFGSVFFDGSSDARCDQPWAAWKGSRSTGWGVHNTTRSFRANDEIELARIRYAEVYDVQKAISDPSDGFMIWLEPLR